MSGPRVYLLYTISVFMYYFWNECVITWNYIWPTSFFTVKNLHFHVLFPECVCNYPEVWTHDHWIITLCPILLSFRGTTLITLKMNTCTRKVGFRSKTLPNGLDNAYIITRWQTGILIRLSGGTFWTRSSLEANSKKCFSCEVTQ